MAVAKSGVKERLECVRPPPHTHTTSPSERVKRDFEPVKKNVYRDKNTERNAKLPGTVVNTAYERCGDTYGVKGQRSRAASLSI